jgi:acetyl-CoA carboxylase alpha subunit
MAESLKAMLVEELGTVQQSSLDELIEARYKRLMAYGQFSGN